MVLHNVENYEGDLKELGDQFRSKFKDNGIIVLSSIVFGFTKSDLDVFILFFQFNILMIKSSKDRCFLGIITVPNV